jgi:acetylornithine deacetylase/succinyl-diaminopimelate desuccinylase-like protein
MSSSLMNRIKRLENADGKDKKRNVRFVFVEDGEGAEEAIKRHRLENPGGTDEDLYYVFDWGGTQ